MPHAGTPTLIFLDVVCHDFRPFLEMKTSGRFVKESYSEGYSAQGADKRLGQGLRCASAVEINRNERLRRKRDKPSVACRDLPFLRTRASSVLRTDFKETPVDFPIQLPSNLQSKLRIPPCRRGRESRSACGQCTETAPVLRELQMPFIYLFTPREVRRSTGRNRRNTHGAGRKIGRTDRDAGSYCRKQDREATQNSE